jgi:hypothetical protein
MQIYYSNQSILVTLRRAKKKCEKLVVFGFSHFEIDSRILIKNLINSVLDKMPKEYNKNLLRTSLYCHCLAIAYKCASVSLWHNPIKKYIENVFIGG